MQFDNIKKHVDGLGMGRVHEINQVDIPPLGCSEPSENWYSSIVKQPAHTASAIEGKVSSPKSRHNNVEFNRDNCVVLYDFFNKSLATTHLAIRHSISHFLDDPVIIFVNKIEHDKSYPKLIIKFAESSSEKALLDKWNPTTENAKLSGPKNHL